MRLQIGPEPIRAKLHRTVTDFRACVDDLSKLDPRLFTGMAGDGGGILEPARGVRVLPCSTTQDSFRGRKANEQ